MNIIRWREQLTSIALQPRQWANSLSRVMPAATHETTVLALDGQWLKLLHVEGLGPSRRITKLLALPVQGLGVEEICRQIGETFVTEGWHPGELLIASPTHLCTVRLFSLPSTDSKEIRDIVELQAEKHTPYARDEVLLDFHVIAREASGYSRVLLVIVHQDVVHQSTRVADLLGWPLERVGCEFEGLMSWFRLLRAAQPAEPDASPTLVVEVDAGTTTLLVMHEGQPQFHRSLAMGLEQLEDDPAGASGRLVSELHRSMEVLESEGGGLRIKAIIVTGYLEKLQPLKDVIQRELDLPAQLVSPWEIGALTDDVRQTYERQPRVSFASLVGLALAPSTLDLTPHAVKLRQAFETRAKALVLLGCQCVALLILFSMLIIGRAHEDRRYYMALREVTHQYAPEAEQVEQALGQLEVIEGRLRRRGQLLEAVEALAVLSPPEIRWSALTYARGETLVLRGTSEKLPKVYEFVASLSATPLFAEVTARRVAKRTVEDRDVSDFEISCTLTTDRSTL